MAALRATVTTVSASAPLVRLAGRASPCQSACSRQPRFQQCGSVSQRRGVIAADSRRGGSVIDKPSKTLPSIEKNTQSTNKRPPIYKVMLHNDSYNKRDYVVQVLCKVVEGMTVDDAVVVMQEAHEEGMALVIACSQEDAERYCETLRLNGLTCTLEPGC